MRITCSVCNGMGQVKRNSYTPLLKSYLEKTSSIAMKITYIVCLCMNCVGLGWKPKQAPPYPINITLVEDIDIMQDNIMYLEHKEYLAENNENDYLHEV